MPLFKQLRAKLLKIIYLAVKNKHQRLVLVKHRLTALGKVDNAEPPESERNIRIDKLARCVGPPVNNPVHHTAEHRAVVLYKIGKSRKATHKKNRSLLHIKSIIHYYFKFVFIFLKIIKDNAPTVPPQTIAAASKNGR